MLVGSYHSSPNQKVDLRRAGWLSKNPELSSKLATCEVTNNEIAKRIGGDCESESHQALCRDGAKSERFVRDSY